MDIGGHERVEPEEITDKRRNPYGAKAQVAAAAGVHPPVGERATAHYTHNGKPVEPNTHLLAVVHHFLIVDFLKHILGGEKSLDQGDEYEHGRQMAVGPHLGFVIGMADGAHAPYAEAKSDD